MHVNIATHIKIMRTTTQMETLIVVYQIRHSHHAYAHLFMFYVMYVLSSCSYPPTNIALRFLVFICVPMRAHQLMSPTIKNEKKDRKAAAHSNRINVHIIFSCLFLPIWARSKYFRCTQADPNRNQIKQKKKIVFNHKHANCVCVCSISEAIH